MRDLVALCAFVALAHLLAPHLEAQSRTTPGATVRRGSSAAARSVAVAVATMPAVVGLTVDSARKLLAGSRVPITERDSSTGAARRNQVIAQAPQPRTPLSQVREIVLVLAMPLRRISPVAVIRAPVVRGVIAPPNSVVTVPPPPPAKTSAVTTVPPLVGRNAQEVLRILARARLRLDVPPAMEFSGVAGSGFVFQQHPLAGTKVDTGSFVKIWISRGPRPVAVTIRTPDVRGLTLDSAGWVIRRIGLVVGHVDTAFESDGSGRVEHQVPEPLAPSHSGDAVALRIALAPLLVAVPRLIGLHRTVARDTLKAAGLGLGDVTRVWGRQGDTVIVAQRPSAGTDVPRGSFVDIEESQPSVSRETSVPDLRGVTRDSAARRLASDSLRLGKVIVSDSGSSPVVVAQQPKAGETVFIGAPVGVTLATRGRDTQSTNDTVLLVSVPQVENMASEPARRLIDSVGLLAVSIFNDAGRSFVVDSQDPTGGSLVPVRATVKLFLSAVSYASVPHLVGQRRAAAASHAREDGYTMDVQHRRPVLSQLFEQIVTQEPDSQTLARGDRFIHVDSSFPIVPPLSATILVVVLGVTAVKAVRGNGSTGQLPLTDLEISVRLADGTAPLLSPVADNRLIRSAVTFTLDAGRGDWIVESFDNSLIADIESHA